MEDKQKPITMFEIKQNFARYMTYEGIMETDCSERLRQELLDYKFLELPQRSAA